MLVYLIRDKNITSLALPNNLQGNYWLSYVNDNNEQCNVLNISASEQGWMAKSNDDAELYSERHYYQSLILENYKLYEVRVLKEKMYIMTFPSYDSSFGQYEIIDSGEITVGKTNCTITYNNGLIGNVHATMVKNDNGLLLSNIDDKFGTYVNGQKISQTILSVGDEIFIMGLRIIYMGNFVAINNPYNSINLDGKHFAIKSSPTMIGDDVPEDPYLTSYDENDYFEKSPRFITKFEKQNVVIDAPPEKQEEDETPMILVVGPMLTMGMTSLVMLISALQRVDEGENFSSTLPTMVMSGAMLLTMVFWPILSNRWRKKQKKKKEEKRQNKYKEYLLKKSNDIQNLMNKEKQIIMENNVSLEECQEIILNRKRNLWEKEIYQDDFLTVRLGTGSIKPNIDIKFPEEHFTLNEDNLKELLNQTVNRNKFINDVPIRFSLTNRNVSAFIGDNYLVNPFIESILLQLITFQSYRDLKLVFITTSNNEKFSYMKNSPYVFNDDMSVRFYGDNHDDIKQISNYLVKIFNSRKYVQEGKISDIDYHSYPTYYLIIADDLEIAKTTNIIKEVLSSKVNYGFSVIFKSTNLSKLPKECTTFINISGENGKSSGMFENELIADKQQEFKADLNIKGRTDLPRCVSNISKIPLPLSSKANQLPKVLSFLEMYNVGNVEQLNAPYRWSENNPTISLNAPVGVDENNELFKLNLHEKVHGPHGLIAGMTGSGKSEFIITYILSMAVNYHPYEVSFVLIDYKGGGLAGAFENREKGIVLPHLAGTITNLDTVQMNRALASIQSELRRRQKLFAEVRDFLGESTIDIYKYQRFYREGKIDKPISHLFIIADEFAELKTQQPEFMKELISTARIGRSLGVHLILATQKPSGVVDEQIWSNSKFRVCLKVQDKMDSKDMIGSPDAAALVDVGRFYLQVGYNEYFALGQSAWTGSPYYPSEKRKKKVDTSLQFINNIGEVIKSVNNQLQVVKPEGEEINNIVKYLIKVANEANIKVDKLWLNQIPELIYIDDLIQKYNYQPEKNIINPIIGEFDDPNNQRQSLLTLPLSKEGNTIIYGMAGSGKEDFLTTMIYSIISNHSAKEVNLYILDFGSEILQSFKNAPQVGDVVSSSEEEKVINLFKMLQALMISRKKILTKYNGDFNLYNKSNELPLPTVVVIINNYEAFLELYDYCNDTLVAISRECFKYGIIIVMTASSSSSIRYKLSQNFKISIPLQLSDSYDYVSLLGKTGGLVPSNIVGRGLIKLDNIYEFQTAYIKPQKEQVDFIKTYCDVIKKNNVYKAMAIPVLPEQITSKMLLPKTTVNKPIPIGVCKDNLMVVDYDFRKNYTTLISSMDSEIFTSFLTPLVKVISKITKPIIIDTDEVLSSNTNVQYFNSNFEKIVKDLSKTIDEYEKIYVDNNYSLDSLKNVPNTICLITNFNNLYTRLSKDTQKILEQMLIKGIETKKISFILVGTADEFKTFEYNEWYKKVVTKNSGIWLGNGFNDQMTIKVTKIPNEAKKEVPSNFGFVVKHGVARYTKFMEEDNE